MVAPIANRASAVQTGDRACSTAMFFALYAAMYGAFGAASPFWPRLLEARGLTPEELGLLLGCGTIVRLVSAPVVGRLADAVAQLHAVLALCMLLAATFAICLMLPNGFRLLLLVHVMQAAALAPLTAIADALALHGAARNGFEYGWLRGTGSAAFVLGTLGAGYAIGRADVGIIVWINPALLAAGAACVLSLRHQTRSTAVSIDVPSSAGLRALLRVVAFRRLILVAALVYGSHAVHDAFAMIRWNAAGIDPALTGILWSEAVVAEVLMFIVIGPKLIARLGTNGAAALAAAAGVLRWIVVGSTTSAIAVAVVQPLHGFTFALTHLACMRLMSSIAPPGLAATAQVLYALGGGLASAVLTVLAGPLYGDYGGMAFLPMALLCAVAVPIAWTGMILPGSDRGAGR